MKTKNIGVCFGNIPSLHDGIGEFSTQLGLAIAKRAPELLERHNVKIWFRTSDAMHGYFGPDVKYLALRRRNKHFFITPRLFSVWHKLHQHNRLPPPLGSRHNIVTIHDLNHLYDPSLTSRNLERYERHLKALLAKTHEIVAISDYVKQDIISHTHWRGAISTIYNGVRDLTQLSMFAPDGVPRDFYFHISRMAESKNVKSLIRVMMRDSSKNLVLAGSRNVDSLAIQKVIEDLAIPNVKVYFNISDNEKAWLYANCRAFLFPSLTEGFGIPPLEAMHFGKSVFCSNRTCLPEVCGEHAFYWDDFEVEAMLISLNEHAAEGRSGKKQETVKRHARGFNWDAAADQYINAYLRALD